MNSHKDLLIIYLLVLLLGNLLRGNESFNKNYRPKYQPPGYVFGIVWTILYIFIGLNIFLIERDLAVILLLHMIFNISWTPIFMKGYYKLSLSLIFIMTSMTLYVLVQTKNSFGNLLIIYLLWLSFAGYLNLNFIQNENKEIENKK